jgi:hypothetical protein
MRLTYKSLEKPTPGDLLMFKEDINEAINALLGTTHVDEDIGDTFR